MPLRKLLSRILRILFGAALIVALICAIRTFVVINSKKHKLSPCSKVEGDEYIQLTSKRWEVLKESLKFKTISHDSGETETVEFNKLLKFLIQENPAVFNSKLVTYQFVANYSLLTHVRGKNQSLLPYMVAGHLDVVPVVENQWSVNPFNATEDAEGTKVYGRGTLDDKGSVMAQLTALGVFLERGRVPERGFYLAYGHDEEIMGIKGAPGIARTLASKGVDKLHFVIDEGMFVLKDMIPGITHYPASIGVSEKGLLNLNISVEYTGGHSSMPGRESAVSIIAQAVQNLQSHQMPGEVDELVEETLLRLAPFVRFPLNAILSNLWLFKPLVGWALSRHNTLQGLVRTTTAPTIFQAGTKYNVIPSSAWAIVNHRIHPKDSKEAVINHVRKTVNDDRIKITEGAYDPPHPVSPFDRASSLPYQVVADTAEQLFENAIAVPGLMVAATDTKHYLHLSRNIFRFNPLLLGPKDIATIHAEDEVISKENYQRMINFYYHLFINADRTELRNIDHVNEEL